MHFALKASNNEAEYKALITGLELAKKLGGSNISIHCDSQLIVNQVKGKYHAKEANTEAYLAKENGELETF